MIAFAFLALSANMAKAQDTENNHDRLDSIEVSLLTCSPHEEIYSLYGHTAIRYTDRATDTDIAINYGMFSFNKPYFALRFIFGRTDYEMGITPFDVFCEEYKSYGSGVTQQTLNLTAKEKAQLARALEENYRPENREYRYNYYYANCTTKARDILSGCIDGKIVYDTTDIDSTVSFRDMIHRCNGHHPWARFGNDMLLGIKSDLNTNISEQQFLPANLQKDFSKAHIIANDGSRRQLVSKTEVVVRPGTQVTESEFPLRPSSCAWILFTIIIGTCLAEHFARKTFWGLDLVLMTAGGLIGLLIFAMLFSLLPTTNSNLMILLFNPLPLFFVYTVTRRRIKGLPELKAWWWLSVVMISLFFVGAFFQSYAEGALIVACSLLIRSVYNLFRSR